MEKRALLAVALAFAVLLAYQFFFMPQQVQKPPAVDETPSAVSPESSSPARPAGAPVEKKQERAEARQIRVETDLYSAVFSIRGAVILHYELKKHQDVSGKNVVLLADASSHPPLAAGTDQTLDLADAVFTTGSGDVRLASSDKTSVEFRYSQGGLSVTRTYTFHGDSYRIDVKDDISGGSGYWVSLGTNFGIHDAKDTSTHVGPVVLQDTDRIELAHGQLEKPESYTGGIRWVAREDKYFFAALVPLSPVEEARIAPVDSAAIPMLRSGSGSNSFILYAGPKEYERLQSLNVGLEHIIDFGFFSIIARPLFWVLKLFYDLIGNYGWAIVLLTIIVRIPFIPLVNKSQKSMKKMQEIQPKMAEVREKFKKDPQRMQKEMMELYKSHKVNPLGGCLPILLQIPVFFALYKILLTAIELRGAPFMLWIQDLSAPDTLFGHIPAAIPLIGGFAVGPLPILMGATMLIQQKMTPTTLDPMQNRLMMLMPIIFTFLFLNFASGLVLYWLMNNIFSIAQQFYVNWKTSKEAK
jgi:YidC/Oxa1 family membrane protein insertase